MAPVYLYIYDLSNGLAAQLSVQLTGRFFKAIYHTSIVFHGREYFFGGSGVESSAPAQSPHGTPIEKKLMGNTEVELELWQQFLGDCADEYGVGKYHLLEHNCNTFSDAALQFLLGQHIPEEVASLPGDFLSTPLGMMLRTQIDAMYAPRPGVLPASVKTEAPVNGPTSGNFHDRISEGYRFDNAPTVSKVFVKLREQVASQDLTPLEAATNSLVAGKSVSAEVLETFNQYFIEYFQTLTGDKVFPGLDIVRLWMRDKKFAQYQVNHPELLHNILAIDYSSEQAVGSLTVLLKLISNTLFDEALRENVVALMRQHDKLDAISSAVLSDSTVVNDVGMKTIWNLLILCDGVDNDFKVACLASVAESRAKTDQSPETETLKSKIIKEILQGGGDEIMDMADILELVH